MTTKQFTKTLLLTLKNTFCKNNLKLQYLPAVKLKSVEKQEKPNDSSESFNKDSTVDSKILADDSQLSSSKLSTQQLQNIISNLKFENEKETYFWQPLLNL